MTRPEPDIHRGAPDLDRVRRALSFRAPDASTDYDLAPDILAALPAGRRLRPAAVLVPLVVRASGPTVILTRRSSVLRHHPGQIAFPGGKVEPDDASLTGAALREAQEEIGLDPAGVSILGTLDTHETVTRFSVTPIVGEVPPDHRATPQDAEVAEVFEVPLAHLLEPANFQIHDRIWEGRTRQYYAVPYGPYYVWGATARILKGLADRMAEAG